MAPTAALADRTVLAEAGAAGAGNGDMSTADFMLRAQQLMHQQHIGNMMALQMMKSYIWV